MANEDWYYVWVALSSYTVRIRKMTFYEIKDTCDDKVEDSDAERNQKGNVSVRLVGNLDVRKTVDSSEGHAQNDQSDEVCDAFPNEEPTSSDT
jgi:hypothetical protein